MIRARTVELSVFSILTLFSVPVQNSEFLSMNQDPNPDPPPNSTTWCWKSRPKDLKVVEKKVMSLNYFVIYTTCYL